MDSSSKLQPSRSYGMGTSSPVSSSKALPLQEIRQDNEISLSPSSVAQKTPESHETTQKQESAEHPLDQSEANAETSLLNENGSLTEAANPTLPPAKWKALGLSGICILVMGTVAISTAMGLLAYIWESSMRARKGNIENGQLWDLIVRSEWTPVTVTLTAAVIRVCLALQMGIFTGMVASILIERTGVPMSSAPLISMLRTLPASPYHLVSRATLTTPLFIAICLAVILTGASQFTSSALLIDFKNVNITTANDTVQILYGMRRYPFDVKFIQTVTGLKMWNSQPVSYFRFAQQSDASASHANFNAVDDSGTVIRAILPFSNMAERINLQGYDGPSMMFDSRVVCTRPDLQAINFTIGYQRLQRADKSSDTRCVLASGSLSFSPKHINPEYDGDNISPPLVKFECPIPQPLASENTSYWPISMCPVGHGANNLIPLPSPILNPTTADYFIVINTTGPYYRDAEQTGPDVWETVENLQWTSSEEGVWSHWQPPPGPIGATVSVTKCLTNLPGSYQKVGISSDHYGFEPSLVWDRDSKVYVTDSIRDRYINLGNKSSREMRGIMELHLKKPWELDETVELTETRRHLASRSSTSFKSVADDMPYMDFRDLSGSSNGTRTLGCAILIPGVSSACAVQNTHAEVFQDIIQNTGSLAQGLQGLFTVLRQMAYYDESRYFDEGSTAVVSSSREELIPAQWIGFILVTVTILVHFLLLAVTTILFLGWTQASWLGNVWASLSQVVSHNTNDLIEQSTDKVDKVVEKTILIGTAQAGGKSIYRVRVRANELNGRNELSLI